MSFENRDLVIERLERQLLEKEREIEDIKGSLKESILLEIRDDLSKDVDVKNRILRVENKVQELTNTINGVMDELLDQKSLIRSLGNMQVKTKEKPEVPTTVKSPEPEMIPEPAAQYAPKAEPTTQYAQKTEPTVKPPVRAPVQNAQNPARARISVQSKDVPRSSGVRFQAKSSSFNIRDADVKPRAEPEKVPEPKSEYIIAESGDGPSTRLRKQNGNQNDEAGSDYIVANEGQNSHRTSQEREELVEAREDEDAVIMVTRRK